MTLRSDLWSENNRSVARQIRCGPYWLSGNKLSMLCNSPKGCVLWSEWPIHIFHLWKQDANSSNVSNLNTNTKFKNIWGRAVLRGAGQNFIFSRKKCIFVTSVGDLSRVQMSFLEDFTCKSCRSFCHSIKLVFYRAIWTPPTEGWKKHAKYAHKRTALIFDWLWLATRAGKMGLSCPLGTTHRVPREKFPREPNNKSLIDQAFSVNMAGYWPRSFFASLWTSTPSRPINNQIKELGQYPAIRPHAWSITHIKSICIIT